MTAAIEMAVPIWITELTPQQKRDMRNLAARVAAATAIRYSGSDLLAYVYMAGLYHGATLALEPPATTPGGEEVG